MTAPTIFVALFSKLKALSLTTKVVATIATVTVIGGSATAIVILSNHDKQTTETPVINLQQKEVEETEEILFETIEETDDTVAEGTTKVKQEGRNGISTNFLLIYFILNESSLQLRLDLPETPSHISPSLPLPQ